MADTVYSANLLENSSCEKQDLSGWNSSGVTAQAGGADGSWCFKFEANAFMQQTIDITKFTPAKPPSLFISIGFKSSVKPSLYSLSFSTKVELFIVYKSGIIDTFTIPCIQSINYADNTDNLWSLLSQDCTIQTLDITQAYIKISTHDAQENFYLDFISVQCNEGISQYVSDALTTNLASLLYYSNPLVLTIDTSSLMVANLGIEATQDANIALNVCLYIVPSESLTLTIHIKLDQKDIPFSPLAHYLNADAIIAIPIAIPQVKKGSHYVSILLSTSTGTASIGIDKLQISIDGRYLAGGVSSEPPHAELTEELPYTDYTKTFTEALQTILKIPKAANISETILYTLPIHEPVETAPIVSLTKIAEQTDFNASDATTFVGLYFIFDGLLHNENSRITSMTKSVLTNGTMYSASLSDLSTINSIEKVEVI